MSVTVVPKCQKKPLDCLSWSIHLTIYSDNGEELTEMIREKFELCANNQNDGLLVIATGDNTTRLIEQSLANKDRYLVVKKQQEWLHHLHRNGRIHICICYLF